MSSWPGSTGFTPWGPKSISVRSAETRAPPSAAAGSTVPAKARPLSSTGEG